MIPGALRRACRAKRCTRQLATVALSAVLAVPSCHSARTLSYWVHVARTSTEWIDVTLEIHGSSRASLDLKGFAALDVMRVVGIRAWDGDGRSLRVIELPDTTGAGAKRVPTPRYRVLGPIPSRLIVRYRVAPGRREGDEHMGFSGRSFGHLGRDFALVTGRGLFLLPEPAASNKRIRVGFVLPTGWAAVAPWKFWNGAWIIDNERGSPSEQLVAASIGLGTFQVRTFRAGHTQVRTAFPIGTPQEEVRRTSEAIEKVVRYVHGLFGRDFGREYLIVAARETPDGDDIVGEEWAFGQGGTMMPLTPERLRRFAQDLIGAYTRDAPFRAEIRHPEEFWLIDGVTNWYSWRAVAAAGLADEEEVARDLASAYLTAMTAPGIERDLEKLYADGTPDQTAQEILAPFALFYLDHELRSQFRVAAGLDPYLSRVFASRSARCLWSSLPQRAAKPWGQFRRDYVRNAEIVAVPDLFALAPTTTTPVPASGPPLRFLTLAYTGNTYGYLENCGCKANQSGGVARRATVLGRIRAQDPQAIILDAGNAFTKPRLAGRPSFLEEREQRLYLETLDLMGYQAATIGPTELARGRAHFFGLTRGLSVPFLASNLLLDGKEIGLAPHFFRARGLVVDLMGILEPPRGANSIRGFSVSASRLTITDPIEAISRALARGHHADLTVVMGRLSPRTIRLVVSTCPDVDLIISTNYDHAQWLKKRSSGRRVMATEDSSGFLGRTLILYTYKGQYGLASARLGVDRSGRIASADVREFELRDDIRDDHGVRVRLNRFYDEVGKTEMAQASVHAPLSGDPYWQGGSYVGAAICAECHQGEYAQWKMTPHASAFKTLLDRHRHYQPSCVSCHVVGFGSEHGYRIGEPENPLGNVQCEVCHGPGANHASDPEPTNIRREVPERVCLECHNPEHSDRFIYTERLPRVRHEPELARNAP